MVRALIHIYHCLPSVTVKLHLVAGLVFRAVFYSWHSFYICINLPKMGRGVGVRGWDLL